MQVITISNLKGGTGKTSIALNLAAGLARRAGPKGEAVVLLDFDPQGNALKALSGTTQYTNAESLAAAIADDDLLELLGLARPILAALVRPASETWYPNLHFIPCREMMLVEVRRRLPAIENRLDLMRAAIKSLESRFEYVVIDTGPSIDDLLVTIFAATDYIVVPVEMDENAIEGAARIAKKVGEVAGSSGRPHILGYVANKYLGQRIGDRNAIVSLQQLFNGLMYESIIPNSIDVRYSQAARSDIYSYAPKSPAALAMALMVEETVQRVARLTANATSGAVRKDGQAVKTS